MQNIGFTHTNKEWHTLTIYFGEKKKKNLWRIEKIVKIKFFFFCFFIKNFLNWFINVYFKDRYQ